MSTRHITLLASIACFRETFAERGFAWVLENTAKLGLDGLELYNFGGEMNNLSQVRRLMNATHVISPSYCCVAGTHFASSDEKERQKAREVIRENLEVCHAIGARIMRIDLGHTDMTSYAEAKPLLLEAICPCVEDARAANVILAIHNHGLSWPGESIAIKNLVETVGSAYLRARVCPGNFLLVEKEVDPVASAVTLIPLAGGILLKDWRRVTDIEVLNETPTNINRTYRCYNSEKAKAPVFLVEKHRYIGASIGKGVIDYARFFESLRAARYEGMLILKTETGTEDDLTALRESIAFVRNAFKDDNCHK